MSKTELFIDVTEADVISRLWSTIEKLATEAIERDDVFRIGLSGGSLIKYLATGAEKCNTDWSKWQLFFCDERYVPEENDDSTFGQYKKLFLPKTKLTESQFVVIDIGLELNECAKDYEQKIRSSFGNSEVSHQVTDAKCKGINNDAIDIFRRYQNLICCCWEWVQMDTHVHCFRVTHC